MKRVGWAVSIALVCFGLSREVSAIEREDVEELYARWLADFANHQPEEAIELTSRDFIMVSTTTVFNRAQALAFTEQLSHFILSRQCTNQVVAFKELPCEAALLLSRVDCKFQTVNGPLDAHFLETIVVNARGRIIYDAFSDLANPSL